MKDVSVLKAIRNSAYNNKYGVNINYVNFASFRCVPFSIRILPISNAFSATFYMANKHIHAHNDDDDDRLQRRTERCDAREPVSSQRRSLHIN